MQLLFSWLSKSKIYTKMTVTLNMVLIQMWILDQQKDKNLSD